MAGWFGRSMEAVDGLVGLHEAEFPPRRRLQEAVVRAKAPDLIAQGGVLLEEGNCLFAQLLALAPERYEAGNAVPREDEGPEDEQNPEREHSRQYLASTPPHDRWLVTESMQGGNGQT